MFLICISPSSGYVCQSALGTWRVGRIGLPGNQIDRFWCSNSKARRHNIVQMSVPGGVRFLILIYPSTLSSAFLHSRARVYDAAYLKRVIKSVLQKGHARTRERRPLKSTHTHTHTSRGLPEKLIYFDTPAFSRMYCSPYRTHNIFKSKVSLLSIEVYSLFGGSIHPKLLATGWPAVSHTANGVDGGGGGHPNRSPIESCPASDIASALALLPRRMFFRVFCFRSRGNPGEICVTTSNQVPINQPQRNYK